MTQNTKVYFDSSDYINTQTDDCQTDSEIKKDLSEIHWVFDKVPQTIDPELIDDIEIESIIFQEIKKPKNLLN